MNLYYKIAGLIALLLALVGAFTSVPYQSAILALLGAYISFSADREMHVRIIVSALALATFAHVFDGIPGIGSYLGGFIANGATTMAGMAVTIVLANALRRLRS